MLRVFRKLYKENKNGIYIVYGPPGTGKSTTVLKLCEAFDPNFDRSKIVYSVMDFVQVLKRANAGELPKGTAIMFEEAGVAADARNWHSEDNILLTHILQTFRPMNLLVFYTVPELTLADKRISQLATGLIECKEVVFSKKCTRVRIYDPVKFDAKQQKWMKRSVGFQRESPNGLLRTYYIRDVLVHKPSKRALKEYELSRAEFSKNLIQKADDALTKAADRAANPPQPKALSKQQIDDIVGKVILERDKFIHTEPGVGLTRFDLAALQADTGLGAPSAKVVKAAVKAKMTEMGFKVGWR